MKIALITDTHYGARKSSKTFHDFFQKFYDNVFFPTLEERGIKTVIHLGDAFDSRKTIDFWALDWAKKNVYDKFRDLGVKLYNIVGNHDAYYKNTNDVNSINSLLTEYKNVVKVTEPKEYKVADLDILLVPWICQDNHDQTFDVVKKSKAKVVMGHLELNGFQSHRGHVMDHGMDPSSFDKFDLVFSGHYHTRSNDGKIFYIGNPYQMFWNDVDDKRGFHIFDTETLELRTIDNPFELFKKIHYNDTNHQLFDYRSCSEKYVKLIVEQKSSQAKYNKFVDKLLTSGAHEVKIIENVIVNDLNDVNVDQIEDTVSMLKTYVDDVDTSLNKKSVMSYIEEIYREACEVG
jgi:DNA repair exonuclease SbcCD nuclease subunit